VSRRRKGSSNPSTTRLTSDCVGTGGSGLPESPAGGTSLLVVSRKVVEDVRAGDGNGFAFSSGWHVIVGGPALGSEIVSLAPILKGSSSRTRGAAGCESEPAQITSAGPLSPPSGGIESDPLPVSWLASAASTSTTGSAEATTLSSRMKVLRGISWHGLADSGPAMA